MKRLQPIKYDPDPRIEIMLATAYVGTWIAPAIVILAVKALPIVQYVRDLFHD